MSVNQSDKEQIFNSAADLADAAQRAAYLDQACGGDAQLRVEIEELLRHDVDAGSFLEHPAVDFEPTIAIGEFDTVDDSSGEVSLEFLKPSDKAGCLGTLEHYEVIELVGRGGMGLVLKAFDPKLNRVVAIKVMAPELAANAMAVKRFLREARATAAVSHDHVVTIHAIHDSHQPPFIVMEFVDGQSLQEKIDQTGGLELEGLLRIGMQTARGLAAAHEQGLVHRDIKPANVLLENGVERVKLTDFGLARAVDDVSVTQTGQIAGTPQFMSPEQAQGYAIDARSDLFSLGSVLYTMCTGRPPFRADSAVAMLRRVTDDDPRPIREVNADIPDWLEAITAKLLAKDPEARFGSAAEVADLLSQHLAHLQHPATAPKPQGVVPPVRRLQLSQPAAKELRRDPIQKGKSRGPVIAAGLAVGACLMLVIVAGVVFFVRTNYGTIRVEVNDPNTTITIDEEMGVNLENARSGALTVRAGDHKLHIKQGDLEFETETFRVMRGEGVVVSVEFIEGKLGARLMRPQTREAVGSGWARTYPNRVIGLEREAARTDLNAIAGSEPPSEESPIELTEVRRFEGHTRMITSVAASPAGRSLLSADESGVFLLSNLENGKAEKTFAGHALGVRKIRFSRDGTAFSCSTDQTVRRWDVQSGQEIRRYVGHTGWVSALAVSPDGKHLLTGSTWRAKDQQGIPRDNSLRLWDVETGKELRRFEDVLVPIKDVAFAPDGKSIVAGSENGTLGLWDVETGKRIRRFLVPGALVASVAFSPDGTQVASSHVGRIKDGKFLQPEYSIIILSDVKTAREIRRLRGHTALINSIAYSPDGKLIASVAGGGYTGHGWQWQDGHEHTVRIWDAATGEELAGAEVGSADQSVAFTPDGRHVVTGGGRPDPGSADLRLWRLPEKLWPVEQLTQVRRFTGHTRSIMSVAVSSDGRFLLSADRGGVVMLSNLETGKAEATFAGHAEAVWEVSFSQDGKAFSCSSDQTVRSWDVQSGQEIRRYVGHTGWVGALAVSPDRKHLVTGSIWYAKEHQGTPQDNSLRLWDVETGKEIRRFEDILFPTKDVAFSPDGETIVAGGENSMLGLWDVETGKPIRRFPAPANVVSVAFSLDGTQVASSHHAVSLDDGKLFDPEHSVIILWDVKTGREIRRLRGHTAKINSIAFSPEGNFIASAAGGGVTTGGWRDADENSVRIWDVATGEELARAEAGIAVQSVAFTPDGRHVVTGGGRPGNPGSADLRLWRLPERVWSKNEDGITEVRRLKGHTKRPMDLLFLADGKHALSCSGDETIRQWNIETGEVVRQFVDDNMRVPSCLALSADEKILLSGHGDGDVLRIWDFETRRVLHRIDAHQSSVFDVGFIRDTNQIVTAAYDNYVRYWDSTTGEKVGEVGPLDGAACFTVAPDGNVLHGRHDRLQFFGAAEHTIESELLGHRGGVSDIAVSPNAKLAASASQLGPIYLWDLETGEQLARLDGHTGKVTTVTFTPDNRHVLSGGWDRTLRVWNVETHQEVARATTEHRVSLELAVSPDGRSVLAGGGEWWDNDNKKWVAEGDYDLRLWRLPSSVVQADVSSPRSE